MNLWAIAAGVALGAMGALWHLAITFWRAKHLAERGAAVTLLALPVALAGPVVAVLIAARVAPQAAWATVVGLVIARFAVLHRWRVKP